MCVRVAPRGLKRKEQKMKKLTLLTLLLHSCVLSQTKDEKKPPNQIVQTLGKQALNNYIQNKYPQWESKIDFINITKKDATKEININYRAHTITSFTHSYTENTTIHWEENCLLTFHETKDATLWNVAQIDCNFIPNSQYYTNTQETQQLGFPHEPY